MNCHFPSGILEETVRESPCNCNYSISEKEMSPWMGQAIGLAVWRLSSCLKLFEIFAEHLLYVTSFLEEVVLAN